MKITLNLASDNELRTAILDIVKGITVTELRNLAGDVIKEKLSELLDGNSLEHRVETTITDSIRSKLEFSFAQKTAQDIKKQVAHDLYEKVMAEAVKQARINGSLLKAE